MTETELKKKTEQKKRKNLEWEVRIRECTIQSVRDYKDFTMVVYKHESRNGSTVKEEKEKRVETKNEREQQKQE